MKNLPSLRLLIGFEAAARLGNFSRAAEELCLSQSAISHQIQQLEEQLAQPLFHRVGRGVELTVAGEVLLQSVQKSLHTLEKGLQHITTYMDAGLVTVVAPASLMQAWLAQQLESVQELDPCLMPVLSTDETARFIDEVDVDIHISTQALQQPGLLEEVLFQDEILVLAATPLAQQLAQLDLSQYASRVGLLCLEKNLSDPALEPLLRGALAGLRQRAIYDDVRLLIDALRRGRGIACLPRSAIASYLVAEQVRILEAFPRLAAGTWWIARAAGATRSPRVLQVYEHLCRAGKALGSA